jgi:hypothetical protein
MPPGLSTLRLAHNLRDQGDVPDPKRDGVQIVGVVGKHVQGQFLRVSFKKATGGAAGCAPSINPSGTENK